MSHDPNNKKWELAMAQVKSLEAELRDTTWQDHADAWQKRALKAEDALERALAATPPASSEPSARDMKVAEAVREACRVHCAEQANAYHPGPVSEAYHLSARDIGLMDLAAVVRGVTR